MVSLWVVNASPIILLGKVGQIDLLQHLGTPVVIPQEAVDEIQRGGPTDPSVQALAKANWLQTVTTGPIPPSIASFQLGDGESAVLAHAQANPGSGVIVDDRVARNAAAVLGLPYQGTLGLILFAKSKGLLTAARPVIEQLRQEGMFLTDKLMNQALAQVGA